MKKKYLILFTLLAVITVIVFAFGESEAGFSEKENYTYFGLDGNENWQFCPDCTSERFTDNMDGTITDNLLNIMWDKNGNNHCNKSWNQALCYCQSLNLAGYCDWRLPTVKELESVISTMEDSSFVTLSRHSFSNVKINHYWASTSYSPVTIIEKYVTLQNGYLYLYDKSYNHTVMAVRSL